VQGGGGDASRDGYGPRGGRVEDLDDEPEMCVVLRVLRGLREMLSPSDISQIGTRAVRSPPAKKSRLRTGFVDRTVFFADSGV